MKRDEKMSFNFSGSFEMINAANHFARLNGWSQREARGAIIDMIEVYASKKTDKVPRRILVEAIGEIAVQALIDFEACGEDGDHVVCHASSRILAVSKANSDNGKRSAEAKKKKAQFDVKNSTTVEKEGGKNEKEKNESNHRSTVVEPLLSDRPTSAQPISTTSQPHTHTHTHTHNKTYIHTLTEPLAPKIGEPYPESLEVEVDSPPALELLPTEKLIPNDFAQKAINAWIDLRPKECPTVSGKLTKKRRDKLRALEKELGSTLPLEAVFYSLAGSKFHRGLEKGNWKASFDFCIRNLDKFYELAANSLDWIHKIPKEDRLPNHNDFGLALEGLRHA